jgi:Zn-dependent protease
MHDHERDDWYDEPPRISFSLREVLHLAASVVILTVAFALVLGHSGDLGGVPTFDLGLIVSLLPYAAVAVVPAFILHELAHKIVAQRKDMWAEFRASPLGLTVGFLVTAFTGFLFASPGAVEIVGDADRRDAGVISIVGPAVNITIAALALGIDALQIFKPIRVPHAAGTQGFGDFFELIALLNIILAAFNMLPVGPLDGRKVFRWTPLAFFGVWALIVALAIFYVA